MASTTLEALSTPHVLVNTERTRRNVSRLAKYASKHGLSLRPHTKTHKSVQIAQSQLKAGASGLTVAKVGEAEVLSGACDDILVAYPIVDGQRAGRLAKLAGENRVIVAIDSVLSVEVLSAAAKSAGTTVEVLIDLDAGYGRTGVQSIDEATKLGQSAESRPGLQLNGLFVYPGHIQGTETEQAPKLRALSDQLQSALDQWSAAGLCTDTVSGGSTPTAYTSHNVPQLTEIRPGTYVYNDMNTVRGGYCDLSDCSATIVATVVSDAVPNQVVLDAGTKALTSDLCGPAPDSGHGYIVEFPAAKITHLTEEHAQVDTRQCAARPKLGQRVHIVPNHICVCINLQDQIWLRESERCQNIEPVKIDGRGLLT